MNKISIILLSGAFFALGLATDQALAPSPSAPTPKVSEGEVSDLIARLMPLVKDKRYEWQPGVTLTFYGTQRVRVELEIDNANKYTGTANTLRQAVERIMSPSADIKKALEGWRSNP